MLLNRKVTIFALYKATEKWTNLKHSTCNNAGYCVPNTF